MPRKSPFCNWHCQSHTWTHVCQKAWLATIECFWCWISRVVFGVSSEVLFSSFKIQPVCGNAWLCGRYQTLQLWLCFMGACGASIMVMVVIGRLPSKGCTMMCMMPSVVYWIVSVCVKLRSARTEQDQEFFLHEMNTTRKASLCTYRIPHVAIWICIHDWMPASCSCQGLLVLLCLTSWGTQASDSQILSRALLISAVYGRLDLRLTPARMHLPAEPGRLFES